MLYSSDRLILSRGWDAVMENLKPEIYRERLIIEGFYSVSLDEDFLKNFLLSLSEMLRMKVIAGPFIFSPDSYSTLHHGLGGFMAWAESGVAFYSWSHHRFFTLDIYSCKPFNMQHVLDYARERLKSPRMVWKRI
ncbi:MAG: S-adenosylmethionine decarboxylase [Candidatus Bathyarchaeota archaeon]|nr:S-adenosylmethionine decarboxylase [Candidatus Bathyarchaeota archaeon]MCX8177831.1 S-adenosylmethionine decarboxylase [Candidatus Bathyarchaeota archaeon]MDW8193631.1 S-adenosylmethionine decarboxylase [Nitrososphaerota archaeon]